MSETTVEPAWRSRNLWHPESNTCACCGNRGVMYRHEITDELLTPHALFVRLHDGTLLPDGTRWHA